MTTSCCHFHRMVQRQQDHRGAYSQGLSVTSDGGGHDQRRWEKLVLVLVVLPKEAGVEAGLLRQLRFGDNLVDTPGNVIAPGRIGDGAVYTKFHNHLSQSTVKISTSLYSAPKPVNEKELLSGMTDYGRQRYVSEGDESWRTLASLQQTAHLVGEILHGALPGNSHVSQPRRGSQVRNRLRVPAHWYSESSRLGLLGFAGNGRVLGEPQVRWPEGRAFGHP